MKKIKGFTLVELLAVIALIGVLAVIAVPSVNKQIEKARQKTLESYASSLEDAAKRFITKCIAENHCDKDEGVSYRLSHYVTYGSDLADDAIDYNLLKSNGYIEKLVDPQSGKECQGHVEVTKKSGKYSYSVNLSCENYTVKTNVEGENSIKKGNVVYEKYVTTSPSLSIMIDKEEVEGTVWYSSLPKEAKIIVKNIDINENSVYSGEQKISDCSKTAAKEGNCTLALAEGNYKISVKDEEKEFEIKIDNIKPTIQKVTGSTTWTQSDTVKYNLIDATSGVQSYELFKGTVSIEKKTNEEANEFTHTFTENVAHTLKVCDKANNCGTYPIEHKATNKAPQLYNGNIRTTDYVRTAYFTLSVSVNDDTDFMSKYKTFEYYLSTSQTSINNATKNTGTYGMPVTITANNAKVTYYVFIKIPKNDAGLSAIFVNGTKSSDGQYVIYGPYQINNLIPECSITASPTTKTARVTLTATVKPNGADITTYYYGWLGDPWTKSNRSGLTTFIKEVDANQEYGFELLDDPGHHVICKLKVDNIDNSVPKISYSYNGYIPSGWTSSNVTLTTLVSSSTDSLSTLLGTLTNNGNTTNLQNKTLSGKTYTENDTYSTTGIRRICKKANTQYVNALEYTCSEEIYIDKSRPSTLFLASYSNNGSSAISDINPICNSYSYDGSTICSILYKDENEGLFGRLGNSEPVTLSLTFKSIDNQSGINRTEYSLDNSNWEDYSGFQGALQKIVNNLAKNATGTMYLRTIDNVGNISYATILNLTRKTTDVG